MPYDKYNCPYFSETREQCDDGDCDYCEYQCDEEMEH